MEEQDIGHKQEEKASSTGQPSKGSQSNTIKNSGPQVSSDSGFEGPKHLQSELQSDPMMKAPVQINGRLPLAITILHQADILIFLYYSQ